MRLIATAVACALIALAGVRASENFEDEESEERCNGWTYFNERCYKIHPRVIEKKEDTALCRFNYNGASVHTIRNADEQKFVEKLIKQMQVVKSVIILPPTTSIGLYGNWKPGEPKKTKIDEKCVAMDVNDTDHPGEWFINDCHGQLLCSKPPKPGSKIVVTTPQPIPIEPKAEVNVTVPDQPKQDNQIVHINGTEKPVEVSLREDEDNQAVHINSTEKQVELSLREDAIQQSSTDQEGNLLAGNTSTLVVMAVIAIVVICLVLAFAYRLRKKAQLIALQSNDYDQNLYFDKRDLGQDGDKDFVLFEKEGLKGAKPN